jgi:hypothetical protein
MQVGGSDEVSGTIGVLFCSNIQSTSHLLGINGFETWLDNVHS